MRHVCGEDLGGQDFLHEFATGGHFIFGQVNPLLLPLEDVLDYLLLEVPSELILLQEVVVASRAQVVLVIELLKRGLHHRRMGLLAPAARLNGVLGPRGQQVSLEGVMHRGDRVEHLILLLPGRLVKVALSVVHRQSQVVGALNVLVKLLPAHVLGPLPLVLPSLFLAHHRFTQ